MGYLSSRATCALRPVHPELRTLNGAPGGSLSGQNETLAPQQRHPYSITSSARVSSVSGTVRPNALAVLRLIDLVGAQAIAVNEASALA
jgi:hypothetical protein